MNEQKGLSNINFSEPPVPFSSFLGGGVPHSLTVPAF